VRRQQSRGAQSMAQIVAGFGVPHTPIFPHFVKRDGPDCEIAKLFGAQKEQLTATRPDLIVMFDTDHLNTFFLDALPIFAIGVDKNFKAPNDEPRDVPNYVVPSLPALAAHIRAAAVGAGYDVAMTQHFSVDHSVTVPLHFLTPDMKIPVIPFFISGHVPPLPPAQRCYALGQAVARAIEAWPAPLRVVVMGSGSFSLEVGGPRMAASRSDGVPDPDWAARVIKLLEDQKIDQLIAESTQYRMLKAGNVGGELLNWIAMLGAIGSRKPTYVAPQMQNGHAYGVWRWN
jgi:gallate dioxygenase